LIQEHTRQQRVDCEARLRLRLQMFQRNDLGQHSRQPRHQYIRAEEDHEAVGDDHAAVGKHDDDPASRGEKETNIVYVVKANDRSMGNQLSFPFNIRS
jgi:hypothetical protein